MKLDPNLVATVLAIMEAQKLGGTVKAEPETPNVKRVFPALKDFDGRFKLQAFKSEKGNGCLKATGLCPDFTSDPTGKLKNPKPVTVMVYGVVDHNLEWMKDKAGVLIALGNLRKEAEMTLEVAGELEAMLSGVAEATEDERIEAKAEAKVLDAKADIAALEKALAMKKAAIGA